MDVRFETTGCRLNQIESEGAARLFVDKLFNVSLSPMNAKSPCDEETRLCVVNTCAVTQKAEQKDRRIIRLLLEKCPHSTIVVTGCYAQLSLDFINSMSDRIACLPGQAKSRLVDVSEALSKDGDFDPVGFASFLRTEIFSRQQERKGVSENAFKFATESLIAHSRPSLKIQDGCNCMCSYCTINFARGHSVSLDANIAIERVKALENAGAEEVVFTSVNIGQYHGNYEGSKINFAELLKCCLKETKKINFRISSLYPEVVTPYFADVISDPRVRPHFHISVQSGSDKILKDMNRSYLSDKVRKACDLLKEAKGNPFLACDIITGFPGETDKDFEDTMELCKYCGFAWVHVFPFSARPGTKAFNMTPKIPQSVSGERAKRLSFWATESKASYIDSCKGQVFDAILETVHQGVPCVEQDGYDIYHAVTENFLHTEFKVPHGTVLPSPGSSIKLRILGSLEKGIIKGGEIECLGELI